MTLDKKSGDESPHSKTRRTKRWRSTEPLIAKIGDRRADMLRCLGIDAPVMG
jgi:hypothetical protein